MATRAVAANAEPTGRVGHRRQVVIPQEIFEQLQLQEGDLVAFTRKPGGVLMTRKRGGDRVDALTPAEAKKVRQGASQIKQGRFKLWRDVKHEVDR